MKALTIALSLSSAAIGAATHGVDQQVDRFDDHHMQQSRRALNVKVDVCLDATNYFGWSDGDNFLRLYHECECFGDLSKDFRMECTMKSFCFSEDDGLSQKCITRKSIYDFHVDPESGYLQDIRSIISTDIYESGFPFSGNFTSVSSTGCIQEVRSSFPQFSIGQIIEVCNEHCPAFLEKNQYSQEQIQELCPVTFLDGKQCNSHGRDSCRKTHAGRHETVDSTLNPLMYLSTPDCSNVYPCLTSSCQAYPQVDTAPQRRLFSYPKCKIVSDEGDKTGIIFPASDDDELGLGGPANLVEQSAAYHASAIFSCVIGIVALLWL